MEYTKSSVENVAVMDTNDNSALEFKFNRFLKFRVFIRNFFHDPASRTQIIKFCGIGILNAIVSYGAFFLLVNYLYYLVALLNAHIIGVINSFLWNKYWVFKTKKWLRYFFVLVLDHNVLGWVARNAPIYLAQDTCKTILWFKTSPKPALLL